MTNKPDDIQVLIAKLRLFGNNIPDSENAETELDNVAYREAFLKAADVLAHDHAIVERVTTEVTFLRELAKHVKAFDPERIVFQLDQALNSPEQPPRSEGQQCRVNSFSSRICELGTQCCTIEHETPAVAKCEHKVVGTHLVRGKCESCHELLDWDGKRWNAAAPPKP